MNDIAVSVLCVTYNHEKYIKEAIDSFLSQITTFNYEIIIHDDASSDETPRIVEEYVENNREKIIFLKEKENQYNKSNFFYDQMLAQARGRFIALCDGDDYWVDVYKLQKQYDFMMANDECTLYIHNGYRIGINDSIIADTFPQSKTCTQEEILVSGLGSSFPISSSMFWRKKVTDKAPKFFFDVKALDFTIKQCCACFGKVYYSSEPMSVYRTDVTNSFMNNIRSDIKFYKSYIKEMMIFFDKYNKYTDKIFDKLINLKISSDLIGLCAVVPQNEVFDLMSVEEDCNMEYVKNLYRILDINYLAEEIIEIIEKCEDTYIYGTSYLAEICYAQIKKKNLNITGFVVSDGYKKTKMFRNEMVYELGELNQSRKIGIILAVQPVNMESIEINLKNKEIEDYCKPYYKLRKGGC